MPKSIWKVSEGNLEHINVFINKGLLRAISLRANLGDIFWSLTDNLIK